VPDLDVLRDRAMEWIYDQARGRQSEFVSLEKFIEETDIDLGEAMALVRDLADQGLVSDENALGDACAKLTGHGIRYVQQLRKQRNDPVMRSVAARNGLLRYFYEQDLLGAHMPRTAGVFATDDATFMGDTFTAAEVERAAEYLEAKGLIKGASVAEIRGPVAAQVTGDGQDCMERHGGDVADYLRNKGRGTSITTHIGTVNNHGAMAVGSTDVTQTVNVNEPAAIAETVALLLVALPQLQLPADMERGARAELVDVQQELASARPRRDRVREALRRADLYLGGTANLMKLGADVAEAWDKLWKHLS